MFKKVSLLLVIVFVLASLASTSSAQNPVYPELPDLGGRELTVAVENAYAPFQFNDPRVDHPIGFDYDLIEELAERLNFKPVYELTSWEVQMAAVGEGQYDLGVNGISIKEERKSIVTFSDPYVTIEIYLLIREDEDRFSNLEEFVADDDNLLGVVSGGANYWLAQGYIEDGLISEDQVVVYNGFAEAVQALVIGDIDAIPADASSVGGFVNAIGAPVRITGEPLDQDEFGIIFPLDVDPELLAAFNAGIATMHEDGYLDYLAYKWLVRFKPASAE
ncbi:MAG: basic amino acid ABC transporter substrate-binding protein [Phototrophicales bacterium]|nr:MAG: basic amino acid ABC transporter substrate-binding protein [Phototrophicales bacterium]